MSYGQAANNFAVVRKCGSVCGETIGDEYRNERDGHHKAAECAEMRQTYDDEIDQCDCPCEESGGVGPVCHREMPLLQPPQRNKECQKGKTDTGPPKGDAFNRWSDHRRLSSATDSEREGLKNACCQVY